MGLYTTRSDTYGGSAVAYCQNKERERKFQDSLIKEDIAVEQYDQLAKVLSQRLGIPTWRTGSRVLLNASDILLRVKDTLKQLPNLRSFFVAGYLAVGLTSSTLRDELVEADLGSSELMGEREEREYRRLMKVLPRELTIPQPQQKIAEAMKALDLLEIVRQMPNKQNLRELAFVAGYIVANTKRI